MALRGETIGTAYVRILADGSRLDKSIKDRFKEQDPLLEKIATEQGEKFQEDFERGYNDRFKKNKKTTFKELIKAAREGAGDFAATGKVFSKNFLKELRTELRNFHEPEIGDRIWAGIQEGIVSGSIKTREELLRQLKEQNTLVSRAVADIQRDEQHQLEAAQKEAARVAKQVAADNAKSLKKIETDWHTTTSHIANNVKIIGSEARRSIKDTRTLLADVADGIRVLDNLVEADGRQRVRTEEEIQRAMRETSTELTTLTQRVKDFTSGTHAGIGDRVALIKDVETLTARMKDFGQTDKSTTRTLRHLRRDVTLANPTMDRFRSRIDLAADSVGKLFGRGSRNNFLNWFGSMVRGFTKIINIVPTVMGLFSDVFRTGQNVIRATISGFSDAREAGAGFFTSLQKGASAAAIGIFESVVSGGTSIVAGLIVLSVTIQLITAIIGPLVAALSLLLGIVAALASTVAFAVAGALAPLAGALAPIAFLIGGIVVGIVSMDDALKKTVTNSLKPFKDTFKELGDIIATNMFADFPDQMKRLHDAIDNSGFRTLARGIGKALSKVIDMFVDITDSRAFKLFITQMGKTMPRQIELLGSIGANAFKAMLGLIRALGPITNRFLKWVNGLVEDFSKWVNSKKGQKELREFFRRAADSAESLGKFLGKIVGFVATILDAGKKTGDSIFDKMADSIGKATEFLTSKEGQQALKDWFSDAEDLAGKIGDIVQAVIHFIDVLDTPENRKAAIAFFGFIADTIEFIADHWESVKKFMTAFFPLIGIVKAIIEMYKGIKKFVNFLVDTKERIHAFVERVKFRIKHLKEYLDAKWDEIKRKVSNTWELIKETIKAKIAEIIAWARSKLVQGFDFVWGKIKDGARSVGEFIVDRFRAVVDFVRGIPGKIRDMAEHFGAAGVALGRKLWEGLKEGISTVGGIAADIAGDIGGALINLMNDLIDKMNDAIPDKLGWGKFAVDIDNDPIPHISLAAGGIVPGPTRALIGEAGAEAIVPLNRPLALVDPAVRELSAIAQGLASTSLARKSIEVGGITVITPTKDPVAVAQETVNAMSATGYF